MIRFGALKRFWIVWVGYWLVYLSQPVNSIYVSLPQAWLLQFLFVIALSLAYFVGASTLSPRVVHFENINQQVLIRTIRWGLLISMLGTFFLVYDKLVLQEIDYTEGLAMARDQWVRMSEAREGKVSSLFSAFGYLFGGAYFVSLALAGSRQVRLSDQRRMLFLFFGLLLLMANSALTGGRSSILLAIAFVSYGYFSSGQGKPLWQSKMIRLSCFAIGAIFAVYSLYIFYARALRSEIELAAYSLDFLGYLGLEPKPWFIDLANSSTLGELLAMGNLAVSYLTHSFVTTGAILEYAGDEKGQALFSHLISISAKIGLVSSPNEWFLSGRFPSLPGGLYFMYGLSGLLFGSAIIGVISGLTSLMYARRPDSLILFFVCGGIECILLLSPFMFAGDLLFFPFIVVGGSIAIVAAKMLRT